VEICHPGHTARSQQSRLATATELYPKVVDALDPKGGVPSRLLKTNPPVWAEKGRHAMVDIRRISPGEEDGEAIALTLDGLAREGARRMIAAALRAEADEYVARFEVEVDEDGHRLVVRNGRARERKVTVGSGTVPVRAPRVNDRRVEEETGERRRFSSEILPAYARRSPKVTEVLPILYLRGLSTGDFRPALEDLLGEEASGLSPSTRSAGCVRSGRSTVSGSASGTSGSRATRTCSSTASTSRCGWGRMTSCACWW
jgi:hypothetical protein